MKKQKKKKLTAAKEKVLQGKRNPIAISQL